MRIKSLIIEGYAYRFQKLSNRFARYTFLNPKVGKIREVRGVLAFRAEKLLAKMCDCASKSVTLDRDYVKKRHPQLLTTYLQGRSNNPALMIVGYDSCSFGDPVIKAQLIERSINTDILDSLKPADSDASYLKQRMLFSLFPDLQDYVCFEPVVEQAARELSQITDFETAKLAVQYMGFAKL
ncbi:MAG TPA: hypothetical protein PLB79_00205 [Thermotogota bacterium]|jgi:hypothetical protein|nr:MAG: hypothetical protein BWX67_01704 [Thermotogota bacterium ADurb.Bin062]HNW47077.1 hypothetical protein [Thermotogota bacterium]HOD91877.1 hypothetical protein [Thermotogota bacterium]HOF24343.1 hypothetical protein [Thermotogota bacterium]HOH12844.1 hypothetical protein [Thermotogota bacterium]